MLKEMLKKVNYKSLVRRFILSLLLFFIMFFVLYGVRWIHNAFGSVNLDEVFTTMDLGLAGTDAIMYDKFIRKVLLRAIWSAIPTAAIYASLWSMKTAKLFRKIMMYAIPAVVLFFMLMEFRKIDTGSIFSRTTDFYEKEYVFAKDVNIKFPKPRNTLVVILESIEKAYDDKIAFGPDGLIPNIAKLENENVSFSDFQSYPGMTFTLGGICGITTGVPLLFSKNQQVVRFAGVPGLGHAFADNNYRTFAFFPAGENYSNKNGFMKGKGFKKVFDGSYYLKKLGKKPEVSPFSGVDDATMLRMVRPQLKEIIADKSRPYLIVMETINTHIEGYPTKACYDKSDKLEDIVKCFDGLLGDFIQWFRKTDPTAVIVLVNDHNTMYRPMTKKLSRHEHIAEKEIEISNKVSRPMTNVFINSDAFDGARTDRKMTAADFYPTIIEAAGGIVEGCRLGLGTSVSTRCKDVMTLRERYGDEELPRLFQSKNKLYKNLLKGQIK